MSYWLLQNQSSAYSPVLHMLWSANSQNIMSVPAQREAPRNEKIDWYFEFKQLRLCAHIDISHSSV